MTSPTVPYDLGVGDVLAVRTGGLAAWAIRFGARLRGLPSSVNHIAIMTHWTDGVPYGIEGRPGGVGWVDLRSYLASPATVSNQGQPRTPEQRSAVRDALTALVGTPYDFAAIAADALDDLDLPALWAEDWDGKGTPGHVVCSSLAAYVYGRAGLARPLGSTDGRRVQPAHWADFIQRKAWEIR